MTQKPRYLEKQIPGKSEHNKLYQIAKELGIRDRSKMSTVALRKAIARKLAA